MAFRIVHAGVLDGRNPHGRQQAYEQSAFRTVRAMSDIMMHGHKWDLAESMKFCVDTVRRKHGPVPHIPHDKKRWFDQDRLGTNTRKAGLKGRVFLHQAPHGELLDGSHHLWFELETTLRGVGHHMVMIVGKTLLMKLFRDRSAQLGNDFVLKQFVSVLMMITTHIILGPAPRNEPCAHFNKLNRDCCCRCVILSAVCFLSLVEQMDDVVNTGQIPFSLIRWQMTGLSDEVDRLLPPPGQLSLVPLE
jgi:hypothetical protein